MDSDTINQWTRAEQIAKECNVRIVVNQLFRLERIKGDDDNRGLYVANTVGEVLAFLCGYEHSTKAEDPNEISFIDRDGIQKAFDRQSLTSLVGFIAPRPDGETYVADLAQALNADIPTTHRILREARIAAKNGLLK